MVKMLLAGVASLAFLTAPASAAQIIVGAGNDSSPLAPNNDFKANLEGLGLTILRTHVSSLTLSAPAHVKFEYFGSESGFRDTFHAAGGFSFTETNAKPFAPRAMFTATFLNVADFDVWFTSSGRPGEQHRAGTEEFGVFLPTGTTGAFASNVVWFGYDDQISGDDDNHDDFIIRATVTPVPEPATWAMLIAGFGLVGATMRRRTPNVSYA